MKGRMIDLSFTRSRKQRLTVELDEDITQTFDQLHEAECEIIVRKWHAKRSLDANAYAWVLIDRLAEVLGMNKTLIYRRYIKDVGGNNDVVCVRAAGVQKLRESWERNGVGWLTETMPSKQPGCVNVILYYGSSTYDSAQMSRLIDLIIQDCKEQGIETMSPAKLAAMLRVWDDRKL